MPCVTRRHQHIVPCYIETFIKIASILDVCNCLVLVGSGIENAMWVMARWKVVWIWSVALDGSFNSQNEDILTN